MLPAQAAKVPHHNQMFRLLLAKVIGNRKLLDTGTMSGCPISRCIDRSCFMIERDKIVYRIFLLGKTCLDHHLVQDEI